MNLKLPGNSTATLPTNISKSMLASLHEAETFKKLESNLLNELHYMNYSNCLNRNGQRKSFISHSNTAARLTGSVNVIIKTVLNIENHI